MVLTLYARRKDVLVEDSVVRQGNGLVIGTSSHANFVSSELPWRVLARSSTSCSQRNITFRNCTAIGTAFGCHIKFKEEQTGSVSGVVFEDIVITNPQRYAIGIDQNGQGTAAMATAHDCSRLAALAPDVAANVTVNDIVFRNVSATVGAGHRGGCFLCNSGPLACRNISFDHVRLQVEGSGAGAGCSFNNVFGTGVDVFPSSCVPPPSALSLKLDDGGGTPPPPAPSCAAPPKLPAPDAMPLYHVLHGAEPRGAAICQATSTNAVVLKALCSATKGCVAFTIGSGGGEPGDLPPHDCRGSRLYAADALSSNATAMAKPGVDLFLAGSAPPANLSTVTPKPRRHMFPDHGGTVRIDRARFSIEVAPGSQTNGVLRDNIKRFATDAFVGAEERDDRDASMAMAACHTLQVAITDANDTLAAGVDESYHLEINADMAELRAKTVWGARHGLETFAQLLVHGRGGPDSYFADVQTIDDRPHYSYRGLMVVGQNSPFF